MSQAPGVATLDPVFVVGAPRSGTTMLAAMLGSHSAYAAGPESQFFSKLSPLMLENAVSDPEWPGVAARLLGELTLAGQPVIGLFGLQPTEVERYLATRKPSIQAMLEALTVPFALRCGKPGWVEKTPNHLLNLETIRSLWPNARIVRIVRDPRDSAFSSCNLEACSDSFVANIYMWRIWQDAARHFFATDQACYTIRYESLVERPEAELGALCGFLGVPYEPTMLDFSGAAASVSSPAETWKKTVSQGLSRDRMFAWKGTLGADMKRFANDVTHEYLQEFGYERDRPSKAVRLVYRMSQRFVERHEPFLLGLSGRDVRWLPAATPEQADMVAEQPEFYRFRNPVLLARLALARAQMKMGWIR